MRQLLRALVVLVVIVSSKTAFATYGHYWTWLKPPDKARLAACLTEMDKVARARPDLVADIDGVTGPDAKFLVTLPHAADSLWDGGRKRDAFALNGIGPNAAEPFNFPGGPAFNFTKTLAKPYDAVVTASLIVARTCFTSEELQIESDGTWDKWIEGRQLYSKTFGKDPPNVFVESAPSTADAPRSWFLLGGLIAVSLVAWMIARGRRTT